MTQASELDAIDFFSTWQEARTDDEGDYRVVIANEHGEVGLAHQHQQFLAFVLRIFYDAAFSAGGIRFQILRHCGRRNGF